MSTTVLALEMLLQELCIDLQKAAELILSDVGATIRILLLIGREHEYPTQRLSRMGDCLASLDVGTWFHAIADGPTFACDPANMATTEMWRHCRLVAQYAQLVAESIEGVQPDDAYLVGLLHEIKAIPSVLGWSERKALCAVEGGLPLFVLAAMRIVNTSCPSSTWRFILTEAHELAGARASHLVSRISHPALTLTPRPAAK